MFFQLHEFHEMLHPLYLTLLCEQGFFKCKAKIFFFFLVALVSLPRHFYGKFRSFEVTSQFSTAETHLTASHKWCKTDREEQNEGERC